MSDKSPKKKPDILKKLNIRQKKKPNYSASKSKVKAETEIKTQSADEETFEMVATCMQNLEDELEQELIDLGAKNIKKQKRAIRFEGDLELLYKCNIWLRTAIKVLKPMFYFKAHNEDQLYKYAKKIAWETVFTEEQTFSIDFSVFSDHFKHSQFTALRLKDAIVDRFREVGKNRPNVERDQPDVRIHLHVNREHVRISLDSSGDPLFKRGYRMERNSAPINESLAAGLILKTGWRGEKDFLDPMCGSGTLAIEAALIASNIPPNLNRTHFAFEAWADYDQVMLSRVLGEAKQEYRPLKCKILAREINSSSLRATRVNINEASMRKSINIEQADFFKAEAPFSKGIMVINPPYGERLNVSGNLVDFYTKIGSTLKHEYPGWEAWIITSDIESFKNIGLKPSKKYPMMNGKLECQFRKYELFEGKRVDNLD